VTDRTSASIGDESSADIPWWPQLSRTYRTNVPPDGRKYGTTPAPQPNRQFYVTGFHEWRSAVAASGFWWQQVFPTTTFNGSNSSGTVRLTTAWAYLTRVIICCGLTAPVFSLLTACKKVTKLGSTPLSLTATLSESQSRAQPPDRGSRSKGQDPQPMLGTFTRLTQIRWLFWRYRGSLTIALSRLLVIENWNMPLKIWISTVTKPGYIPMIVFMLRGVCVKRESYFTTSDEMRLFLYYLNLH